MEKTKTRPLKVAPRKKATDTRRAPKKTTGKTNEAKPSTVRVKTTTAAAAKPRGAASASVFLSSLFPSFFLLVPSSLFFFFFFIDLTTSNGSYSDRARPKPKAMTDSGSSSSSAPRRPRGEPKKKSPASGSSSSSAQPQTVCSLSVFPRFSFPPHHQKASSPPLWTLTSRFILGPHYNDGS